MTGSKQGVDEPLFNKTTAWEFILLALAGYREARNQGAPGIAAVVWSIRNRVIKPGKQWYGNDWEEVILKPWQYSSFNAGDPNAQVLPGDPSADAAWATALDVGEQAYLGLGIDPTDGATHYYAKSMPTPPAWVNAPDTVFVKEIGEHRFYKAN